MLYLAIVNFMAEGRKAFKLVKLDLVPVLSLQAL